MKSDITFVGLLTVQILGNDALYLRGNVDEESPIVEYVFYNSYPMLKEPILSLLLQNINPISVDPTKKEWITDPPYMNTSSVNVRNCIHIFHPTSFNFDASDRIEITSETFAPNATGSTVSQSYIQNRIVVN